MSVVTCRSVNTMKANIWCGTITFDPRLSLTWFTCFQFDYLWFNTIRTKIVDDVDQLLRRVHDNNGVKVSGYTSEEENLSPLIISLSGESVHPLADLHQCFELIRTLGFAKLRCVQTLRSEFKFHHTIFRMKMKDTIR